MVTAILVFLATFVGIATERLPRTIIAVAGAVMLLFFGVLDIEEAMSYVSWETIGLLFGMFILVAVLTEAGLFSFLAIFLANKLNYDAKKIFIFFPLFAGLLAAFIDSITVMLFLASLSYEISRLIRIDPVPLVIAEVCLANIGGAATLVGDPPNVILGTILGFGFNDFVIHTGTISVVVGFVVITYFYLWNKKKLTKMQETNRVLGQKLSCSGMIKDREMLKLGLFSFFTAIILLITHRWLEASFGISISTAEASLIPAVIVLILGKKKTENILTKIDGEVLLFFVALFIIVGGLEKTGVINIMAQAMIKLAGGNPYILLFIFVFIAGFASGIVDNVPLALTMAYILKDISQTQDSLALSIMVWALALGVDIGGNITPIGASANVVSYTYMEQLGKKIGWKRWIANAFFPTFIALVLCYLGILLKNIINWY